MTHFYFQRCVFNFRRKKRSFHTMALLCAHARARRVLIAAQAELKQGLTQCFHMFLSFIFRHSLRQANKIKSIGRRNLLFPLGGLVWFTCFGHLVSSKRAHPLSSLRSTPQLDPRHASLLIMIPYSIFRDRCIRGSVKRSSALSQPFASGGITQQQTHLNGNCGPCFALSVCVCVCVSLYVCVCA
jgi:hypothetical protein